MAIKLLALDIDDTLVYDVDNLSKTNREAIALAQSAGVFVTVATGRGYKASEQVFRAIDIEGPVINYGGALINDTRTGQRLFESEVDDALIHTLLDYAKEHSHYAHVYDGDTVVTREEHWVGRNYTNRLKVPLRIEPKIDHVRFLGIPKVLYIVEPERVDEVIEDVRSVVQGRLKVSKSAPGFVEFNHTNAHKGAALEWLASHMGLDRMETAAMGDNTLDLEMVEWAGIGAAVGNATGALKEIADVVAPACREDGVAWFIHNYVL